MPCMHSCLSCGALAHLQEGVQVVLDQHLPVLLRHKVACSVCAGSDTGVGTSKLHPSDNALPRYCGR